MHPLNRFLHPLGIQIHRATPPGPPQKSDFLKIIEHFGINVILDVGAHEGVSAQKLFEHGYRGRIVSFEPISSHFRKLQEKCLEAQKHGHAWEARQLAMGNVDSSMPINIAGNGQSSSLAAMLPVHEQLNPESKYVSQEEITVARLDTIADSLFSAEDRVLWQLDVQGFEPQALEGGARTLSKLAGVQLEVNFRPAYATGLDVASAFQTMEKHGFTPCYVEPAWKDVHTAVFYQVDVLWFRIR